VGRPSSPRTRAFRRANEAGMASRIDYARVEPGALRAMYGLEKYVAESSVERPLRESATPIAPHQQVT